MCVFFIVYSIVCFGLDSLTRLVVAEFKKKFLISSVCLSQTPSVCSVVKQEVNKDAQAELISDVAAAATLPMIGGNNLDSQSSPGPSDVALVMFDSLSEAPDDPL